MIAYEELEKALARWKIRRANGAEAGGEPPREAAAATGEEDAEPAVIAAEGYENPDRTGELDLADAEVTEA